MITRIEAYNYRCFSTLSVDLDRYHVLAGANGAGKTTLLDLLPLLGDMLHERRITTAFLQRLDSRRSARASTPTELLHHGTGDHIAFAVEAQLPSEVTDVLAGSSLARLDRPTPTHLRYELGLEVSRYGIEVAEEHLFLFAADGNRPVPGEMGQGRPGRDHDGELRHPDWQSVITREGRGTTRLTAETTASETELPQIRVPPAQLALATVLPDPGLFPAALWLAQLIGEGVVFFDPEWDLLRQPAPPGDPLRLMPSGRNTPWLALYLHRQDPERFASWIDHVRTALPQVESIRPVEREEDRYAYFAVRYSGGYEVTSSGLSDGTLRVLALTLLPYLPADAVPALIVTEEPENGIHPRAIETVMQSLSSLYEAQVWVSTHSPIALAHTDLADVLVARLNTDDGVSVVRGNRHPRLVDWRGSLDVGSLFAAGVLA
ncbi:Predicted ATPase [Micromonospora pallida]|uniref:Predicted ATPase n=1 Tax=Micromonospora pallida TaxID=145854 RepID=A0A1C6TB87_9ACTN|nr:AAA family ATPase [Micromonospora pallida]SCL38812.1 Predicted ATPase [Micromonospora pallida]